MKLRLIEIAADGAPARCPGHMPPMARDVIEGTVNLYEAVGFAPPWIGYLTDRDGDVVGSCAFKGAPLNGRVEIAYQTFPEFEGRGIASETVRQLVQLARQGDGTVTVLAQTPPAESASTHVLRKNGFVFETELENPDEGCIWQWALKPEDSV